MKLSEEVDGQVTREWRSCESNQGGSCVVGIPRAKPRMRPRWIGKPTVEMKRVLWSLISCEHREEDDDYNSRKKEDINKSKSLDSLHGRAGRESNHKWNDLATNLVVEDEAWEPEQ
ncbi:unnamed protein product [Prunus armeniaca]